MKSIEQFILQLVILTVAAGWTTFALAASPQDTSTNLDSIETLQFGHGTNWETQSSLSFDSAPTIEWEIECGAGRSQIVGRDGIIYVACGAEKKVDGKTRITTILKAVDLATGETKWTFEQTDAMHGEQENFSGATIGPQATPAVSGDRITMLSFTGQVTCLNINDGTEIWKKDLVDELRSVPVQFGFSSSPFVNPSEPERIYVLGGGTKKDKAYPSQGLYCFDANNGEVIWTGVSSSFSYSTPVFAKLGGVNQFVITNRDGVYGVELVSGRTIWEHKFAEAGLTNVPTPLVVDDSHLVISGQGCKGTRGLEIQNNNGQWTVKETWYSRKIQYFYTNWAKLADRVVLGCTEKLFVALDPVNGNVLGRWRGFSDGNLLLSRAGLWLLDGKGKLNFFNYDERGLTLTRKYSAIKGRSWTPLTIIDDKMLLRADDRLVCLSFDGKSDGEKLENQLTESKRFDFDGSGKKQNEVDPVALISETFASKGKDAALKLYSKLRKQDPSPLTVEARIALANVANEQGLGDVAGMVLRDALEDFPDSKEIQEAAGGKK